MIPRASIVGPCDCTFVVDAVAGRALAVAGARARGIDCGDFTVCSAHKAMHHIARINVGPRDRPGKIDATGPGPLTGGGARSRSVECGDGAARSAQESV